MGGGQANKGQASQSFQGGQQASAQDMALSQENLREQQTMFGKLFGSGKDAGSGGTLGAMLDPKSLDVKGLSSPYQTQFNEGTKQVASDYANQRGALARNFANQGATPNSTPNGFQADQENKLARGEADTRGAMFAGLKGQQHQDALNNFWNAANVASGQAAGARGGALEGAGQSGSTQGSLYGTAGAYHQSPTAGIIQSGIGAGGTVGAAAMCPAEGSKILMADNSRRLIEHIRKGDLVMGIDGRADEVLEDPTPSLETCCEIHTRELNLRVSLTHTFVRQSGGYCFAGNALAEMIETDHGPRAVLEVKPVAEKIFCRHLFLKRSHGYNANGMWSLQ